MRIQQQAAPSGRPAVLSGRLCSSAGGAPQKKVPPAIGRGNSVCEVKLLEVPLQQALQSLAVPGLVASHLVDGALAALAGRFASCEALLLYSLGF